MNHKVLFILSIIVIVVGIGGIFFQNTQHPQSVVKEKPETVASVASEKEIMVAEALRDLKPYDILTADDYRLISLKVSSTVKDYRDISSLSNGDIKGALLRSNVASGSSIIPAELVIPTDPSFISASLREGEASFSVPILPIDDYILSTTHTGDKMDIYIRLIEVERNKKSDINLAVDGASSSSAKASPKYVTSRLFKDVIVLESKRFEKSKDDEKGKNKYKRDDEKDDPIGNITLRMSQKQVVELITVAKAGQLILLPEGGDYSAGSKIRMDDVLPQFRSVKELRGRK